MCTKIILGTVQFGLNYGINNNCGKPSKKMVFQMLEYAASKGILTLDTADSYGNATDILGDFNTLNPGLFSINTKFCYKDGPLSTQISKSLNSLRINSINTYFFHNHNDLINYPKLLKELIGFKKHNLIKKIGVSIYDNYDFLTAINTPEIDVIQFPFNLLDNRIQRGELIINAKKRDKELQARSVFLQGLFFTSINEILPKLNPLKPYLNKIRKLSNVYNLPINEIALLYALNQDDIDNVIIGADNLAQLENNIIVSKHNLISEIKEKIDEIVVKEIGLLYPKNWN